MTSSKILRRISWSVPLMISLLLSKITTINAFQSNNFCLPRRLRPTISKSSVSPPSSHSLHMNSNQKHLLYGIPNSSWKSPQWNWGSAMGTGHDCAAICRRRWSLRDNRSALVQLLLDGGRAEEDVSFEELKLILGLAWQKGRWDGSDGGVGGYSEVLGLMAGGERYEIDGEDGEVVSAWNFVEDVSGRFEKIARGAKELEIMEKVADRALSMKGKYGSLNEEDRREVFVARMICAGLVLDSMNFVDSGL
mmetsp:Transcript_24766/g.51871  ORF Transcript_24766/g.51871 Transcript_24766/m.51871 type:complete len:250 (+) Transcript_24766:45-794(+)